MGKIKKNMLLFLSNRERHMTCSQLFCLSFYHLIFHNMPDRRFNATTYINPLATEWSNITNMESEIYGAKVWDSIQENFSHLKGKTITTTTSSFRIIAMLEFQVQFI